LPPRDSPIGIELDAPEVEVRRVLVPDEIQQPPVRRPAWLVSPGVGRRGANTPPARSAPPRDVDAATRDVLHGVCLDRQPAAVRREAALPDRAPRVLDQ